MTKRNEQSSELKANEAKALLVLMSDMTDWEKLDALAGITRMEVPETALHEYDRVTGDACLDNWNYEPGTSRRDTRDRHIQDKERTREGETDGI